MEPYEQIAAHLRDKATHHIEQEGRPPHSDFDRSDFDKLEWAVKVAPAGVADRPVARCCGHCRAAKHHRSCFVISWGNPAPRKPRKAFKHEYVQTWRRGQRERARQWSRPRN